MTGVQTCALPISTNQVIVTPTPSSSVKLDELNRLVKEMESGTEAAKRMAELDKNSGIVDPAVKRQAEQEFKRQRLAQEAAQQRASVPAMSETTQGGLDDRALAGNMLAQAKRMESEAQGLIAEAARMKKEAEQMFPGVTVPAAPAADAAPVTPKRRGRPAKPKAVADAAVQ